MTTHIIVSSTGNVLYTGSARGAISKLLKTDKFSKIRKGSDWNGYGYTHIEHTYESMDASIDAEVVSVLEVKSKKEKIQKSENELIQAWVSRLCGFFEISEEEAYEIANDKIAYKAEKIEAVRSNQYEKYSVQRERLINKMQRENPLRRIEDISHAEAIIIAHRRHNMTNYDNQLDNAREMAKNGEIDRSEVKCFARLNLKQ